MRAGIALVGAGAACGMWVVMWGTCVQSVSLYSDYTVRDRSARARPSIDHRTHGKCNKPEPCAHARPSAKWLQLLQARAFVAIVSVGGGVIASSRFPGPGVFRTLLCVCVTRHARALLIDLLFSACGRCGRECARVFIYTHACATESALFASAHALRTLRRTRNIYTYVCS